MAQHELHSRLRLLLLALCSPLATHDESFPVHMVQHLLIGMLAPLLLALSAPVTLALRVLAPANRRRVIRFLHAPPVRVVSFPPVAALIYTGSMWLLYLSPLYAQTLRHPLLHEAVHAHFLLAGCLFAWTIVGLDPMPRRGSINTRVVILLFVLGGHAALAKLIYAGWLGGGLAHALPPDQLHTGAELMYYGGDTIDVLLLVAFFAQWYIKAGHRLSRQQRYVHGPLANATTERRP